MKTGKAGGGGSAAMDREKGGIEGNSVRSCRERITDPRRI